MTTDRKPGTTKEEEKMYAVMEAIFDSGIPISFKGSMVMKAFLVQAGYQGGVRHTKDIDGNWNTDYPPTSRQVAYSVQQALDEHGIGLDVRLFLRNLRAAFFLADFTIFSLFFHYFRHFGHRTYDGFLPCSTWSFPVSIWSFGGEMTKLN